MITEEFKLRPYDWFHSKINCKNHHAIRNLYEHNYEHLRCQHPVYRSGWHHSFFFEHRYMNWIIYALISEYFTADTAVLDIGCYDGMLVHLLAERGQRVQGWDANSWDAMWQLLKVGGLINNNDLPEIEIAIMFNYHHNFKPDELFDVVKKRCGGKLPKYLFMDRETSCKHPNNIIYYDENILEKYNIQVVTFTECNKYNRWTCRDLMIWQNEPSD